MQTQSLSTELLVVVVCAILALLLPLIYSGLYAKQVGAKGLTSNRDEVPEPTGAAGRGLRAHRNLLENLVPFAAVVLIAHALGISTAVTRIAALTFLGARLIHAACYLAGITGIRTLAYNVGMVASLVIAIRVLL